jgi:hypothetical protein
MANFESVLNAAVHSAVIAANQAPAAAHQPLLTDAQLVAQIVTALNIK